MATRAKETNPSIVKEKRKISSSPSFPRPTNTTRKSVNTTTTTAAPNYIKSTKPSNIDPLLKPVSTKASSSTLPKPDLARRKSFSSSPLSQPKKSALTATVDGSPRSTSTIVSPKPRTERSRSSSSLKAPASPLAKVDTTARKPVPVKSSRPVTRPATRPATTAVYRKKQPQSNAAAKIVISTSSSAKRDLPRKSDIIDEIDARKSDHEVERDSCQDIHDQESLCSSVVDANNENDNIEMLSDMVHDDQLDQINEEAYLLSEVSTVVSEIEQSEAELENKVNEITEKLQQDNANNDESRSDADNAKNDESSSDADNAENDETRSDADDDQDANSKKDGLGTDARSDADNDEDATSKKDGLETEEEKVTDNETNDKISVAAVEEEEAVDENNEKLANKEKVVEQVSGGNEQVNIEKDETKKKINSNPARWSTKKESPPASNDVIEEAASKLRVQRKNKVSALIGAFETVMSSQD